MRGFWVLIFGMSLILPGSPRADDIAAPQLAEPRLDQGVNGAGDPPADTNSDTDWWGEPEGTWWGEAEFEEPPPSELEEPDAEGDAEPTAEESAQDDRRSRYNECRRLPRQIEKFKLDLQLAKDTDNDVYEQVYEDHISRLRSRYESRCPQPDRWRALRGLGRTLAKVGRLAFKAFTLGML